MFSPRSSAQFICASGLRRRRLGQSIILGMPERPRPLFGEQCRPSTRPGRNCPVHHRRHSPWHSASHRKWESCETASRTRRAFRDPLRRRVQWSASATQVTFRVETIIVAERMYEPRRVERTRWRWNSLFSINFGIPNVNPRATRAMRIIGFLSKARGETGTGSSRSASGIRVHPPAGIVH